MPIDKEILWNDKYKLGIDTLDTQNKHLFILIGKLYALDDNNNTKKEFIIILNELNEYMKTHFKYEEKYMLSIKYPELELHKQLHQDLIDKLTQIVKSSSKLSILKIKIRIIAKRILIEHIVEEDIKMKLFKMSKINKNLIFDSLDEKGSFDITNIMPDV